MNKVISILLGILISVSVFAQNSNLQKAHKTLNERGELYFKFTMSENNAQKELNLLTQIISVDKVKGNEVTAYANASEFNKFIELGIDFKVLTAPSLLHNPDLDRNISDINEWDYYPTYEEYVSMMNQFVTDYPNLCELVNIGNSIEGREILFIHINNNLGEIQNEPEFMYTSTMHGDEVTGYVLMLRYIDYLLQNYGTNSEVTNLVNNIDIWINPLANPDGTYAGGNSSVYGATRSNANNIDLNRNFADPEDGPHPDGNEYQVETIAFMDFAEDHNFVMSSNMHGGAEVVNYPWDTYYTLSPDNSWWVYVCREYADIVHANSAAGYLTDLNNGITNGAAWYSISGGRQDYMNYYHNCREMTLELSTNKMPSGGQLPDFWEYNYRSFNTYMAQSLNGFSGVITNAATGDEVAAKVFVENHDDLNSWVFSHQPLGNYFRPMYEGTYNVTYSAFGYYNQTIEDVVIENELDYELNVELIPYTTITAGFTASATAISTGSSIDFEDDSWGTDIISWYWTFEGGTPANSTEENPTGIIYSENGNFDVTLTVSNLNGDSDTKNIEEYISVYSSYNMSNETVTTCNALFLDSGGENNNYSDDEDFVMTFLPGDNNSSVKMEFTEFNVENELNCGYDYLEIYDGSDINTPLIGKWCGVDSPGTLIASNDEGALTVYFHSDNNTNLSGWKAIVTCDSNVGVITNQVSDVKIFPNPASDNIHLTFDGEISNISLQTISGKQMLFTKFATENYTINTSNLPRGIYLLSFVRNNTIINKKIVLN